VGLCSGRVGLKLRADGAPGPIYAALFVVTRCRSPQIVLDKLSVYETGVDSFKDTLDNFSHQCYTADCSNIIGIALLFTVFSSIGFPERDWTSFTGFCYTPSVF